MRHLFQQQLRRRRVQGHFHMALVRLSKTRWLSNTTIAGYQSIGSFHSENLADIMSQSKDQYIPPALPFAPFSADDDYFSTPKFMLDPSFTFLNHGAFGAALQQGFDRAHQWRQYLELQPLRFFDRDLLPHLAYTARLLSEFVRCHPQSIVLLPNVTAGLNAVLSGHARHSKGNIFYWDTTYGSVKKMIHQYYENGRSIEIPFQAKSFRQLAFASQDPDSVFIAALRDTLEKHHSQLLSRSSQEQDPPLFLLDHTSSNTALTFPIDKLAAEAKEICPNMLVVVDGAHGLLAQHLDFSDSSSQINIYLTNCHKWFAAPRGVAFMVVADKNSTHTILRRPAIVSHGVDEPDLFSRFVWDGCRDYAAALAVPAVLEVWKRQDASAVRGQMKAKLAQGIELLSEKWHPTSQSSWSGNVTLASMDSGVLSPMALVKLPGDSTGSSSADAKRVQDYLFSQRVEVPVKCINGELFVRLSSHVYNNQEDFRILRDSIHF